MEGSELTKETMDDSRATHICIIDDNEETCRALKETITSWGIASLVISEPSASLDVFREFCFEVILLDQFLPRVNGFDLIPKIRSHCPDSKIIVMTGYASKGAALKAAKLGAFQFLEKPFGEDILFDAVCRALEAYEKDRSFNRLAEDLKHSRCQIHMQELQFEHLNMQLHETNKVLSSFVDMMEIIREQTAKATTVQLRSLLVPLITKLRQEKGLAKYHPELDAISRQIMSNSAPGLSSDGAIASILSPSELRIASLISDGLTTEEIADHLHISTTTVRTHRKNIRRKLNINKGPYSLKSFLLARCRKDQPTGDQVT